MSLAPPANLTATTIVAVLVSFMTVHIHLHVSDKLLSLLTSCAIIEKLEQALEVFCYYSAPRCKEHGSKEHHTIIHFHHYLADWREKDSQIDSPVNMGLTLLSHQALSGSVRKVKMGFGGDDGCNQGGNYIQQYPLALLPRRRTTGTAESKLAPESPSRVIDADWNPRSHDTPVVFIYSPAFP
ncbi:hypothetical protein K469DRAFT_687888 [Zopfia rhizophila CBS 207.26]|uniref:Uncharacterized protein n=1 Tax=Zopfia rhizophila CBS 207.26 TaxID=1314779 RepID=A0A6A6E0U8_9PEZI|nr:hypothetical protein K469DRAFT_687888 [Zopfia rhizophila CBS 207.26]